MILSINSTGGVIGAATFGHHSGPELDLQNMVGVISNVTSPQTGLYEVEFASAQPDDEFYVPAPGTSTAGIFCTIKRTRTGITLDFRDLDGDPKNARDVQVVILRLSNFSVTPNE